MPVFNYRYWEARTTYGSPGTVDCRLEPTDWLVDVETRKEDTREIVSRNMTIAFVFNRLEIYSPLTLLGQSIGGRRFGPRPSQAQQHTRGSLPGWARSLDRTVGGRKGRVRRSVINQYFVHPREAHARWERHRGTYLFPQDLLVSQVLFLQYSRGWNGRCVVCLCKRERERERERNTVRVCTLGVWMLQCGLYLAFAIVEIVVKHQRLSIALRKSANDGEWYFDNFNFLE